MTKQPPAAESIGQEHWVDGRMVDDDPRPSSPWARILAVIVLLVGFDLAIGPRVEAGRRSLDAVDIDELAHTSAGLRAQLRAAVDDPRRSIVLVGDSVLAGDVMASRYADWDQQRVVDHLRAQIAADADVGVQQIGLDGLLPIDALHILAELDRIDPEGRVEFVFELNLRYFSAAYHDQLDCSRPAICELGRTLQSAPRPEFEWARVREAASITRDGLLARLPVFRWRDRLPDLPPALDQVEGLLVRTHAEPTGPATTGSAEAEARVREHYRSAELSESGAQTQALTQILDRLVSKRRPALLFVTPLADGFVARSGVDLRVGEIQAELARLVGDRHVDTLQLISLDHPLFVDPLFVDHCHLGPEGNRVLAGNLAVELGLPLAERPSHTELIHMEDHDRSLVHRVELGFDQGPAWQAAFEHPRGVTASADGRRVVVADTGNRRLRQLRGNLQIVEVLAGIGDTETAMRDGEARTWAQLVAPREPVLIADRANPGHDDDPVYFLDGVHAEFVRVVENDRVETLRIRGPKCSGERLRSGPSGGLWLLCNNDQVLAIDPVRQTSRVLREADAVAIQAIAATPTGQLLIADELGRILAVEFDAQGQANPATELFANTGRDPLPAGRELHYPYGFDQLRLAKVVDMVWLERYGMLLVADELPLGKPNARRDREIDERIQLRVLDFETEQIWPWIKPIPHGEAWAPWNELNEAVVSYYHRGDFTVIQAEAGLIWLEHSRSRLVRLADGLLGMAKLSNTSAWLQRVGRVDVIGSEGPAELERTLRPDRWLGTRWEPLPRRGPYVGLLVGSSLTTISDRLGNYSLARRLELELQRELGVRDGVRFDLFHRSVGRPGDSGGLAAQLDVVEQFVADSVPIDVLLFEVHELGEPVDGPWRAGLERLAELAATTDALVVVFDDSALDSDRRDGLRATSPAVHRVLDEARALGMIVLEPSDRLLRELMNDAPWGNAPWSVGRRHGAPWAIDHTARVLRSMLYPILHDELRDRVPAWVEATND